MCSLSRFSWNCSALYYSIYRLCTIWASMYSQYKISGCENARCTVYLNNMLCASDLLLLFPHSFAETSKQEQCILITTCERSKLYLLCRLWEEAMRHHTTHYTQVTSSDCFDLFMNRFMRFCFCSCSTLHRTRHRLLSYMHELIGFHAWNSCACYHERLCVWSEIV